MMDKTPLPILVNDWVAFFVAFGSNILLLYLIRTRTPDLLKSYAKILVIHCVSDVLNNIVLFITGVECVPVKNRLYWVLYGILPNMYNNAMSTRYFVSFYGWIVIYVPLCLVTLDFIYRYMLIVRVRALAVKELLGLVVGVYLWAWTLAFVVVPRYLKHSPEEMTIGEVDDIRHGLGLRNLSDVPAIAFMVATDPTSLGIMSMLNVLIIAEYGFIAYAVRKIGEKTKQELMRGREKRVHRQITMIMIVQAAIPLLLCVPTFLNMTTAMLEADFPIIGIISCCFVPWLSAVRPLATILIVPHYRQVFSKKSDLESSTGNMHSGTGMGASTGGHSNVPSMVAY